MYTLIILLSVSLSRSASFREAHYSLSIHASWDNPSVRILDLRRLLFLCHFAPLFDYCLVLVPMLYECIRKLLFLSVFALFGIAAFYLGSYSEGGDDF